MKMKTGLGRKLRYGGVTAALTAAIIAIVVIVNVIFSALAQKNLWYSDLTPELLFTLSENCITLMKEGDSSFENSSSPIEMVDKFRAEAVEKAVAEAVAQAVKEAKAENTTLTEKEVEDAILELKAANEKITDEEVAAAVLELKAASTDISEEELKSVTEATTKAATEKATKDAQKNVKIKLLFCDDELTWQQDTAQRYVLETAKQLRDEFKDYIDIEYVDIIRTPSAVTKYGSGVTTTSVVIECGTEYRVRALKNFYVFDTDDSETPWAYNGEKILAASILAVTRTFTPVACFTTGNGEQLPGTEFVLTLANAGYDVQTVDLETQDIPENCRLIIISSPKEDFAVSDGISSGDEIDKLDIFLDRDADGTSGSLMVFMDPTQTQRLDNLEDYLEEWGIKFDRINRGDGVYEPYQIQDMSNSKDPYGYNIIGSYATFGLGSEITEELSGMGRKVVFPGLMSISYSEQVEVAPYFEDMENRTGYLGDYGNVGVNGDRQIYDLFVSTEDAVALAGGAEVETAKNGNIFKYMTVTVDDNYTQESNYTTTNNPSYVIATGCNLFAHDDMLHGSYGNNMFLEYTLRIVAHEPVPVGLTFKPFGDRTMEIDTVTTAAATRYTVIFTVVPLVLSLGIGIFVIVRRKNR